MTAPPLRHIDPNARTFRTSLKEAVVEGVLRRGHDRLTGRGDLGKIVFGDPPTKVFAAGFLLPAVRRTSDPGGGMIEVEITSPVHVATLGMSFQVARNVPGQLRIVPGGSVYIRLLPSVEDMAAANVTFAMNRALRASMRTHKARLTRERLAAASLGHRGSTDEERRRIAEIRASAAADAFRQAAREAGVGAAVVQAAVPDAVPAVDPVAGAAATQDLDAGAVDPDDVATLQNLSDGAGDASVDDGGGTDESPDDRSTFSWTVKPGATTSALPDDRVVEPAEIPQKWLRLDVTWPELLIDPGWSQEDIDLACLRHGDAMQQALDARLNAWLAADDAHGEPGGLLWAMPRATDQNPLHRILPSQVANWEAHLGQLRTQGGRKALPVLKLRLEVRVSDDPLDPDRRTVRVILSNRSALVNPTRVPDKLLDRALYLAGLEVTAPAGLHRDHVLERVRPSYRWNRWLTHAGLGINCGLDAERSEQDGAVRLTTNFLPHWRQPRIVPFEVQPAPKFETLCGPDGGLDVVRALVASYREWIDQTVQREPWRIDGGHGRRGGGRHDEEVERREFEQRDLPAWQRELARIEIGLKVLDESAQAMRSGVPETDERVAPLRAWRATNAAFLRAHRAASARNEFAPESWRLFQLAFLVSHLPGVISRLPFWSARTDLFVDSMAEDDATASLLYFPTGGGKSEAFFGLLVFQAFVDRIRGKLRGVSAIVRYPLRLLTTQQANRFARIMAMAELERRHIGIGGDPFQIGFWVGGGNTPNYPSNKDGFSDLPRWEGGNLDVGHERRLHADDAGYRAVAKWRRLTECPFCARKPIALRRRDEGGAARQRLVHACLASDCSWNRLHGSVEPLPFHVMDTDIYSYAPTVLLGTVDKMAAIAQNPYTIARVFGMFGFAPWMVERTDNGTPLPGHGRLEHPRKPSARPGTAPPDGWDDPTRHECVPIGPVYGNTKIELFDPFPAIEVQDEAHLLEQSLGTFSGLFGSMLETAFAELAPLLGAALPSRLPNGVPRRAKIIAASATVQGPERQIQMLYQRQVRMFPHPGPDLYESYFARLQPPDPADEGRALLNHPELRTPTRRIYVSVPTNGRPHTSATVAVLSALHLTLTECYRWASSDDPLDRLRSRAVLAEALPTGPLRAIHRAAIAAASDDEVGEALDLARILLCYVTTKKGGDSVQAALSEFIPRDHKRAGVSLGVGDGVDTGLITGSVEIDAIQAIVEKAKAGWKPGDLVDLERDFLGALRGVVATSAISHGVDIERLNKMLFAGLPSDVAEYVQASSRVGRTHVGVSILVPTPQRVRDVHVVGIHDVFHRFLERMIQPAAVDRWGENAIDRVVASAVQVLACAVDHYRRLVAASDDVTRRRAWDSSGVPPIRAKAQRDFISANAEMTSFLVRAIGIDAETNPRHDPVRVKYKAQEAPWYEDLLKGKIRTILDNMRADTFAASSLRTFWTDTRRPEPMTSLRDVDEAGVLEAAPRSIINNERRPDSMAALMKRLRHGDGAWGDGEGDEASMEGGAG